MYLVGLLMQCFRYPSAQAAVGLIQLNVRGASHSGLPTVLERGFSWCLLGSVFQNITHRDNHAGINLSTAAAQYQDYIATVLSRK